MRMDVSYNGGAMALLIEHDNYPYRLLSARLRLRHNTLPSFKVRVRVLEVGSDERPGKDLLKESVVLTSSIKKGWLTFDLSNQNLWVNDSRFFLAFEWIIDQESRQELQNQLLAHLQEDASRLSENVINVGGEEIRERTISDYKNGVWFGSLLHPVFSKNYKCYYRINGFNPWQPSAAILTADVSALDFKVSDKQP